MCSVCNRQNKCELIHVDLRSNSSFKKEGLTGPGVLVPTGRSDVDIDQLIATCTEASFGQGAAQVSAQ